jgi:hypothetical protein
MIEYQRIAGLQFGHDAIRRQLRFGNMGQISPCRRTAALA